MENLLQNNIDFVDLFETKLAKYTRFKYAVCVDCCTNAILLSLELLNRTHHLDKSEEILSIPVNTYMSVPMTLKNNNWKIHFINNYWYGNYRIGNTPVIDAATDFDVGMAKKFKDNDLVCISFQQKKRLALGRGGAILLNDFSQYEYLKRMSYDGRNPKISDNEEVSKNPANIIRGYHCYMEPDKAARGILLLNQSYLLKPYVQHSFVEYPDLTKIESCII